MKDLISRGKLLDSLPKNDTVLSLDVRRIVVDAPAVDAVPVVHGRWIKRKKYDMESRLYCSSCKQEYDYIDGIYYIVSGSELPFYCHNCGAKMDGEGDAK